jgi:hypothetical protein
MNVHTAYDEWRADRRAAYMEFTRKAIVAYLEKYGVPVPSNPAVFEIGNHKVVAAMLDMPLDRRRKSKEWLLSRGYHADGAEDI